MKYKELEPMIKRHGLYYVQIKRTKNAAIYQAHLKDGTPCGLEVFKIKRHDGYTLGGKKVEPSETYPGDGDFGKSAWYYGGGNNPQLVEDMAEIKYKEIK